MTHYIDDFIEPVRWPKAVCGLSSRFQALEHSGEPTCPQCAAWVAANASDAHALSVQWQADADAKLVSR